MPNVQIKNVPDQTHAVLKQRAATAHQSLQEYLLAQLIDQADRPTWDEVLARAGSRSGGVAPIAEVTRLIREDRDGR